MYMGWATKCAGSPLIVIFMAARTAWKLLSVTRPSDVWTPVLKVTLVPAWLDEPVPPQETVPAPSAGRLEFAPAPP